MNLPNRIAFVAVGCATAMVASASGKHTATKPNVLYIMCDDMGYGDLGCYGQKLI